MGDYVKTTSWGKCHQHLYKSKNRKISESLLTKLVVSRVTLKCSCTTMYKRRQVKRVKFVPV